MSKMIDEDRIRAFYPIIVKPIDDKETLVFIGSKSFFFSTKDKAL